MLVISNQSWPSKVLMKKNELIISFIGDTSNRPNWGCRATTKSLLAMIAPYADRVDRWDVNDISNAFWEYRVAPINKIWNEIKLRLTKQHAFSTDLEAILVQERLDETSKNLKTVCPSLWKSLQSSDVVVINGEGSFLQRRIPGRLKLLIAYAAKTILQKPVVICNHTSDVRDPVMYRLASHVYPLMDDVLFREMRSVSLSSPLCGDAPNGFAADAVFQYRPGQFRDYNSPSSLAQLARPNAESPVDLNKPYICIGGSSAYLANPEVEFAHLTAFTELCIRLRSIAPLILTAAGSPEDEIFRQIGNNLNIPVLTTATETQKAVDILGNAALYVGGRWHPAIMALTGYTPLIKFGANTEFKSEGLCELAKIAPPIASAFNFTEHFEAIEGEAARIFADHESHRMNLIPIVDSLRESAKDNVRFLNSLVK